MENISIEELRSEIYEIIKDGDLTSLTSKIIRNRLEKKFEVDLTHRKQDIDNIIVVCLHQFQDEDDEEDDSEDEEVRSISMQGDPGVTSMHIKKEPTSRKGKGFTDKCILSPELAAILEADEMTKSEVLKNIWKFIKEKKLYDPADKRFVIPDEQLARIFGPGRFRMFGMLKHLSKHMSKINKFPPPAKD